MKRAAVFIDGGYLSAIQKKFFNQTRVDYLNFSNILCENYTRYITYYYTCMPYQSGIPTLEERTRYANMDRFISAIRKLDRFVVRLGRLVKRNDKFEQKGVDVQFALDLSRLCLRNMIDKAIIVSGDSDFVPAVQEANDNDIITQSVYHPEEFSYHLRDVCDERRKITKELIDSTSF